MPEVRNDWIDPLELAMAQKAAQSRAQAARFNHMQAEARKRAYDAYVIKNPPPPGVDPADWERHLEENYHG